MDGKHNGFEYEADPIQAEMLLEEFGFDDECNKTATPGVKPLPAQLQEDKPLSEAEHTRFRAISARANYLLPTDLTCSMRRKMRADICPTRRSCPCRRSIGYVGISWDA